VLFSAKTEFVCVYLFILLVLVLFVISSREQMSQKTNPK